MLRWDCNMCLHILSMLGLTMNTFWLFEKKRKEQTFTLISYSVWIWTLILKLEVTIFVTLQLLRPYLAMPNWSNGHIICEVGGAHYRTTCLRSHLRYACVIRILFLYKHVCLNGVWFNEDQRRNTLKYAHFKKNWTMLSNVINYSTPDSEHNRRDIYIH